VLGEDVKEHGQHTMISPRLLLVDDEKSFREATGALLRREGYSCECARDASEGFALLEQTPYDLLLTDLRMAGNASLEFLHDVARQFPTMPVLVVTGYPSLSSAIAALRLTVCDYLVKPFELADLTAAVERAIQKGRASRALREVGAEMRGWVDTLQRWTGAEMAGVSGTLIEVLPDGAGGLRVELSQRERDVATAVSSGVRVATIARNFRISPRTVRNHLQSIFRKVGVHSQIELVAALRPPPRPPLR
jgi:DNA-binding NarL/FixJ family response regulator